eukprot:gene48601-6949_t
MATVVVKGLLGLCAVALHAAVAAAIAARIRCKRRSRSAASSPDSADGKSSGLRHLFSEGAAVAEFPGLSLYFAMTWLAVGCAGTGFRAATLGFTPTATASVLVVGAAFAGVMLSLKSKRSAAQLVPVPRHGLGLWLHGGRAWASSDGTRWVERHGFLFDDYTPQWRTTFHPLMLLHAVVLSVVEFDQSGDPAVRARYLWAIAAWKIAFLAAVLLCWRNGAPPFIARRRTQVFVLLWVLALLAVVTTAIGLVQEGCPPPLYQGSGALVAAGQALSRAYMAVVYPHMAFNFWTWLRSKRSLRHALIAAAARAPPHAPAAAAAAGAGITPDAAGAGTERRVVRMCEKYLPAKAGIADKLLQRYAGDEELLLTVL